MPSSETLQPHSLIEPVFGSLEPGPSQEAAWLNPAGTVSFGPNPRWRIHLPGSVIHYYTLCIRPIPLYTVIHRFYTHKAVHSGYIAVTSSGRLGARKYVHSGVETLETLCIHTSTT